MPEPIQTAFQTSLNARPQYVDLAPDLRPIWQVEIPFAAAHTRLWSLKEQLYLLDHQQRFTAISPQKPDPATLKPWHVLDLRVTAAAPGFLSAPLLRTTGASFYRWQQGAYPVRVWQGDESIVRAYGLPEHRLLFQRADGENLFIEMVDESASERMWTQETTIFSIAFYGDQVIILDKPVGGVLAVYDTETGAVQWETAPFDAPVSDFIGLVGGILWLATTASRLLAYDVMTGAQLAAVPIPTDALPRGILSSDALYYCCSGLTLAIFDLDRGGERRLYREFPRSEAQPGTAFGSQMLINAERTLFLFDELGRLYAISAPDYAEAVQLWQATEPVLHYGASGGCLYALQQNGILTALGST